MYICALASVIRSSSTDLSSIISFTVEASGTNNALFYLHGKYLNLVIPNGHSDLKMLPNFMMLLSTICSTVGIIIILVLVLLLLTFGFWKRRQKSKGICVIYNMVQTEVYMQNINLQGGSFKKYHPKAKG